MLKPVPMLRLSLVVLERDERTVLRHLGRAGVVQLTRAAAGPDTAPLPPPDRSQETARCDRLLARLENFRRALELAPSGGKSAEPAELSLDQAEAELGALETEAGDLLKRRQRLRQRSGELTAACEQVSGYRGLDLPLDQPDQYSFLHFVTGTLPAGAFEKLAVGDNVALLPLPVQNGRQPLIALTTRQARAALDRALQQAGFQPETLPVAEGATVDAFSESSRREQAQVAAELQQLAADLQAKVEQFAPRLAAIERAAHVERRLLEADQNFPRTETAVLLSGWMPEADTATLVRQVREITGGRCAVETTAPTGLVEDEVPVLLREPRLLRPFAMLVSAYGLPRYRELEPTLFVALSYLVMFGMMFGDAGHGFILAAGGLAVLLTGRNALRRDIGLLLLACGLASMVFGVIYGSYFGLPQLKRFALWHDPLEGDPMQLMAMAIEIGVGLMGIGLVLNALNHFRRGDVIGGLLDKFGVAGVVFYGGALALYLASAAFRSRGLVGLAVLLLLVAPALGWMLKEPIKMRRHGHAAAEGGAMTIILESLVEAFDGVLSYFANTISFVRLAAYAMSHAALLLATFTIAANVRHFSPGGGALSVLVIILGNLIALVLEGIVASVQALRLEYYEFFGKFFSGGGRPFKPFRLLAGIPAASG